MPVLSYAARRTIRLIAVAITLATAVGSTAFAQTFPAGSVTEETLPNGLRLVQRHSAGGRLVAISVWIHAGSHNETAADNGVAHLLEHYLFQGKDAGDSDPFDREIEGMGGTLNAETARDHTHYYAVVPAEAFTQALRTVARMVLHPSFDPAQLEIERKRAEDEIVRRFEDPIASLQLALFRLAYLTSPYRLPIAGTRDSVSRLTIAQLRAFYDEQYRPDNATVVIVGSVSPETARREVASDFGPWSRPAGSIPAATRGSDQPAPRGMSFIPLKAGAQLAMLGMALPAPEAKDTADSVTMDLIYVLLTSGRRSLIALIDPGGDLISNLGSDFLTSRDPGLFLLWCDVPAGRLKEARVRIQALIDGLAAGRFRDADLVRARQVLLGSYALENETVYDQDTSLGFYDSILSYEYAVRYESVVKSITRDDVQRVAHRYLHPTYTVVMAAPGAKY